MPKKKTQECFIEQAVLFHGEKYSYEKTNYINSRTKITVYCKVHGYFEQLAGVHLKCGCPKCRYITNSDKRTRPLSDFVEKARFLHEDDYDYSLCEYKNRKTKVSIVCSNCQHIFSMSPKDHLRGKGCPECKKTKISKAQTKPFDLVMLDIKEVHGDKYEIDEYNYKNTGIKIAVNCKIHGEFYMTPNNLREGRGCPSCAKHGFDPSSPSVFYLIDCDSVSGSFTGYGITKNISQRTGKHTISLSKSAFVITQQHTWDFPIGSSALALENAVKKQFPQTSRLGCAIDGFKRESTDAPFEQVKEFIESILKENPEWQLT